MEKETMSKLRTQIPNIRNPGRKHRIPTPDKPGGKARSIRPKVSAGTVAWLLKELMAKPCTRRELIDATGLGHDGVGIFCESMHASKLIYVIDWIYENTHYVPVYAFGTGKDITERWTKNERRIIELFRDDFMSRTGKMIAELLALDRSTIVKHLNSLTAKGYLIRNPIKHTNEPLSWRRNPNVPLPALGPSEWHAALEGKEPAKPRLLVKPQSWFSAIA